MIYLSLSRARALASSLYHLTRSLSLALSIFLCVPPSRPLARSLARSLNLDGQNTSVRLFGFREMDPERRHKAQFNGCSCKHGDTLPFFREVFGTYYKMADIRVEPNSGI